jgi:putative PIG3 family NAD(P)H quinone oxidoreductase
MRAIVIREPGGPEVLELREVPAPQPARGEVRVRVRATAVNRADLLQRMGLYPAPAGSPADIPGLEIAGEVDALGEGVTELTVGERVFGIVGGGGYAEQIVVHARALARIPEGMAFHDAGAVPEAFLTAWDAMVDQGALGPGDTALIHAAGSGVGTAGVQVAAALGARPIGTARSEAKLARARELGMADGVLVEGGKFADAVLRVTGGRGADVVLELVGGAYVGQDLACLAPRGRIVVIGLMAGLKAEVDLNLVLRKRAVLRGSTLRARPLEEKIAGAQALGARIGPLLSRGVLRPIVDRVLPLERAAEAHAIMQSNDTFGKIVLEV